MDAGRLPLIDRAGASSPLAAIGGGAAVGVLGGLIGLGGAEFRLPLLMGVFGCAARQAVPLNLLISLATVVVALAGRFGFATFPALSGLAVEIAALASGAVVAGWFGAGLLGRMSEHGLERVIGLLLLGIAGLLAAEAVLPFAIGAGLPADPVVRGAAGVLFGLGIGLVSSLLGVAGGELIIPTLVLAFGVDIKTAGTASLLISLPTLVVGVIRHRGRGAFRDRRVLADLAAPMAGGSAVGAMVGALLVGMVAVGLLKAVLGIILAVSAVKMLRRSAVGATHES